MRLSIQSWLFTLCLFMLTTTNLHLVTSQLGPEPAQDDGRCTGDSEDGKLCHGGSMYSEKANKEHLNDDEKNSYNDRENSYGLAEVPDDKPGFLKSVYNVASSGLSTVYRSAKTAGDNIYDKAAHMSSNIADTLRDVLHQEVYNLLESMYTSIGKAFNTPGAVFYGLGQTAMTVTLFLLCLLLNYIFLRYYSLMFIFVFDSSVYLLHYFMGPKWIFDYIFFFGSYAARLLWWMTSYPKTTAFVIVLIFAYKLIMPIVRWSTGNTEVQKREKLFIAVMDMNLRMKILEDNQAKMLRILRNLERQRTVQGSNRLVVT